MAVWTPATIRRFAHLDPSPRFKHSSLLRPPRLLPRRERSVQGAEDGAEGRNRRGRLVEPLLRGLPPLQAATHEAHRGEGHQPLRRRGDEGVSGIRSLPKGRGAMAKQAAAPLDEYQQRFCADGNRNIRLLAPAGSGKTHSLLYRCAEVYRRQKGSSVPAHHIHTRSQRRASKASLVTRLTGCRRRH